jgi:hypothetical protein
VLAEDEHTVKRGATCLAISDTVLLVITRTNFKGMKTYMEKDKLVKNFIYKTFPQLLTEVTNPEMRLNLIKNITERV